MVINNSTGKDKGQEAKNNTRKSVTKHVRGRRKKKMRKIERQEER
jgi:hypothetical protein